MLRTNTKIVRSRIRQYLLDAAYDCAMECLEHDPTDAEIMRFVVDDINRVMGYRKRYGVIPADAITDYLQGLSIAVDYTYYNEWQLLNKWTENNKEITSATDEDIEKANNKYWYLLTAEVLRWFDEVKKN